MKDFFTKGNELLSKYMFILVSTAIALGFVIPVSNSSITSVVATGLFAYMTFISALKTTFKDVIRILTRPLLPLWVLFLIHGIAPLIAWGFGHWFYSGDFYMRIGLLVGSTIPIAVTSIIWTTIAKGDVALALVTVTLDTLFIPILIPAFFKLVLGTSISLNYGDMIVRLLLMVTVPSILGMVVNELTKGRLDSFASSVGGFTSKLATFIVMVLNSAVVLPNIQWSSSVLKMMIIVFVLVSINYLIGYLGSFVVKERSREVIAAIIFNVGMRNTNFGSVLAIAYFPPEVALPIILTLLYQHPIAGFISYLLELMEQRQAEKSRMGKAY
jgi:predicted Na+-dependent transporter